jgi:uncharacterized membrane protein
VIWNLARLRSSYVLALYPAVVTLPYFIFTDRYASWQRAIYVVACSGFAAVLLISMLSPATKQLRSAFKKRLEPLVAWVLIGVVLAYGFLMYYLAYQVRIRNGLGTSVDLAIYEQVLWASSRGHWFFSSFNNGSFLSGHFAPILIPLSLAYGLVSNISIVFGLQSFLLAAAAIPLYLLARDAWGRVAGLLLSASYLINPAIASQHLGFYLNHLAPFFWFAAMLAYLRKNFVAFVCLSILVASIQEDIALSLLVFAPMAWLGKRSRRWAVFCGCFPLIWFFIAIFVIQASSSATGIALGRHFADLGRTPEQIAQHLLIDPGIISAKFAANSPAKLLWVYELSSPLGFILPFGSMVAAAAFPDWFVFSFVPLSPDQYSVGWYYSLFISTVLFGALALALPRFGRLILPQGFGPQVFKTASALVLCSSLAMLPLVFSPEMFSTGGGKRMLTLNAIKDIIPSQACVLVTYDVAQPFAQRYELYHLNDIREIPSDCRYIVSSQQLFQLARTAPNVTWAREVGNAKAYDLVLDQNQLLLFVRK